MRALLHPLRAIADEIVVALETDGDDRELAPYADVADRVARFERGTMDSSLASLHAQCGGDWILVLSGEEVCGLELIAALPELMNARDALQYSFPSRWLWPDPGHWLAADPWHPSFQIRLVRNDATLRFASHRREVIRPVTPHRFCEEPLWHLGLVLSDEQQRRSRVPRDWADRVWIGAADGDQLNPAFYLPEERGDLPLQAVTSHDHEAIWRVLAATPLPVTGYEQQAVPERGAARAQGSPRAIGVSAFAATITPISAQAMTLRPAEVRTLYLRVRNEGDEQWPWGLDQPPLFRMGYRWHGSGMRRASEPEGWAPFPCDVPPGEERIVPVAVQAPIAPGRWELEIDVALHGERWFGAPVWFAARVI